MIENVNAFVVCVDDTRIQLDLRSIHYCETFMEQRAIFLADLEWMTHGKHTMLLSLAESEIATADVVRPLVAALNEYADKALPETLTDSDGGPLIPPSVRADLKPLLRSEDLAVKAFLVSKALRSRFLESLMGAVLATHIRNMSDEEKAKRLRRGAPPPVQEVGDDTDYMWN